MPHGKEKEEEGYHSQRLMSIIDSALDHAGKGSKQVVLDYLHVRYGMNVDLVLQFKEEFENYLRETLGHSAEIIISRINENLRNAASLAAEEAAPSREGKKEKTTKEEEDLRSRIADVVHFLICDSCFWCASILRERYESRCQSCGREITSAIPVMHNERFVYEVDKRRGITLSFRQQR
ncbi:hypothetical protein [Nitrososphaera sp.]|uniref:hypothetical protein n=1 Tax=Nitrososphaera sp. TaxID=1971748 RepID=UPI00307EA574